MEDLVPQLRFESEPACQKQAMQERRYIGQGRKVLSFLVLWLIEWVKKPQHAGLSLLRKNRCPFCLPLPESKGNRFVISLLPCCALVWEGSQQHRPRIWHISCTLAWAMNSFQIDLFHCFPLPTAIRYHSTHNN